MLWNGATMKAMFYYWVENPVKVISKAMGHKWIPCYIEWISTEVNDINDGTHIN